MLVGQETMEKYHIVLTDEETALLAKIDLRSDNRNHDESRAAHINNKQPLLALLKSLSTREAIPQSRLNWWNDPRYNSGRIKASRKGLYERNGTRGDDIYTHPNFLASLRYILFGVDLPDGVISAFEEKVGNPQWVTSSDIVPLGKCARDLTRQYHLDRSDAPEEFFKLCIDIGLSLTAAESIMSSVKQVR